MPKPPLLPGVWLAVLCAAQVARAEAPRVLQAASRGDATITLDGKLDEPVWQRAEPARDWLERVPVPRAVPPVRTEVRVLYDADALYVGVRAELARGEVPRADSLAYDSARIWNDEAISLKFDVRHDLRTTVGFVINPAGAQLDFVAAENGAVYRGSYDAIWQVETHVAEGYWSAEVRIPTAALGLPPADGQRIIGFNVTRAHNARNASYDWTYVAQEFDAFSAVKYGELHGVQGVAAGHPVTLQPYALVGFQDSDPSRPNWQPKIGGDARIRVASDTWAEVTAFTDFAQVNLDDQVINLGRFPINYPEQRPFFLTGLDVFTLRDAPEILNTRSIGLDAGQEVPILAGAKVYGNASVFSFGAIGVLTDDTQRLNDQGEVVGVPGANSAVARGRVNFGGAGHFGVIGTLRNHVDLPLQNEIASAQPDPNVAVGSDLLLRAADKRLELTGFGAFVHDDTEGVTTDGASAQAGLAWRGHTWRPWARGTLISDDFRPALGFVPRTGIFTASGAVPWVLNTSAMGLRSLQLGPAMTHIWTDELDRVLGWTWSVDMVVQWANGWGVDWSLDRQLDVVDDAFYVVPDVQIQPDDYEGYRIRTALHTPATRRVSADVYYRLSQQFYSGVAHGLSANAQITLSSMLRYSAGWAGTFFVLRDCVDATRADGSAIDRCGNLPGADPASLPAHKVRGQTLAFNSTLTVTPTTRLTGTLTLQVNTVSEEVVGLARIGWRYLPGSELFLVYQQTVDYAAAPTSDYRLALKINYRYDTVL